MLARVVVSGSKLVLRVCLGLPQAALLGSLLGPAAPAAAQCDAEFSGVWGGSCTAVAPTGRYAYAGLGGRLVAVDVLNPDAPVLVGGVELGAAAVDIEILSGHAYIAAGAGGLIVVDIRTPASPVVVARYIPEPAFIEAVESVQGAILATNGSDGLHVVDVSNPADPRLIGAYREFPFRFTDVAATNRYAFVGSSRREIVVVDLFDQARPTRVTSTSTAGVPRALELAGTTLFAADDTSTLASFEASDPTRPRRLDQVTFGGAAPSDVSFTGGYTYLCSPTLGVQIVDARDPADLQPIGLSDAAIAPLDAESRAGLIYFADDANGLVIADFSRGADPIRRSGVELGGDATQLAWIDGEPGDAPISAAIEPSFGLVALDASADAPRSLGSLRLHRPLRVAASGRIAYVLGDDFFSAVSLDDPGEPRELDRLWLQPGQQELAATEGFAILTRGLHDVACVGVSNPGALVVLDTLELSGAGLVAARAKTAYVASAFQGRIDILDFTNPFNLRAIGAIDLDVGARITDLELRGATLFFASVHATPPYTRLNAVSVEEPGTPGVIESIELPGSPGVLAIDAGIVWVGFENGTAAAIDAADPAEMRLASALVANDAARSMLARGGRVLVADGSTGVRAYDSRLPSVTAQPVDAELPLGATIALEIGARGEEPLSFQWRRDRAPLADDGRIQGSRTAGLMILGAVAEDTGDYDCLVTNACGSAESLPARVDVYCAGDFNADGDLDLFDLLAFQDAYGRGSSRADLSPPIGTLNLFDFLAFQSAFGAGC